MNPAEELFDRIETEISKAVIGKKNAKVIVFSTFLSGGNILLEGVPGIAKTLMARTFAKILGLGFSRIQFTPDLMPSDIIGTSIFHQGKNAFEFIPGPLFTDFILADEINRAPAKTQSALLEAMEERQVTSDNVTRDLSENFVVFATQNPLEFEGTYALPEAQLDRFMVRLILDYPEPEDELSILNQTNSSTTPLDSIQSLPKLAETIKIAKDFSATVVVDEKIIEYVRNLLMASRNQDDLILGNSPRAGQMLIKLSKAYAAVNGLDYVTPDHIRELVPVVLPHRWVLKPEAAIQQTPIENILRNIFNSVSVPE